VLRIEMLPAESGDCLWIEYGAEGSPRRILIDGGTHDTYEPLRQRIETLDRDERVFQLLVITHIDNDHIDGIVRLLQNPQLGCYFQDIWFNGWPQLGDPEDDALGPVQGEYVAARLRNKRLPWNQNGRLPPIGMHGEAPPVVIAQREKLPRIPLADEMELVLLSPTPDKLTRLRKKWKSIITDAEKDYPDPGSSDDWLRRLDRDSRYQPDDGDEALGSTEPPLDVQALLNAKTGSDASATNGSSIAFLLEYEDKRCLLAGDAHPKVLADSLELYLAEKGLERLPVDAFKLPHHGSKNNVSKRLLDLLDCHRYLISTDSSGHGHPDAEAMARILAYGGDNKALLFNYRVDQTKKWDDGQLRTRYSYWPRYPPRGRTGIAVDL